MVGFAFKAAFEATRLPIRCHIHALASRCSAACAHSIQRPRLPVMNTSTTVVFVPCYTRRAGGFA
jgi:hypothetical protein